MLCERCQTQEATVNVTLVMGTLATSHDFCEGCYPTVESRPDARTAGWTSTNEPPRPLPTREEIERMSAQEYLNAAFRAAGTAADKPVFKHILAELEHLPGTQERLAFEFANLLSDALEREDSCLIAGCCITWGESVTKERVEEFVTRLEHIGTRCFDLAKQDASTIRDAFADEITLQTILTAIYKVDPGRFPRVLEHLNHRCDGGAADPRLKMLHEIENRIKNPDQSGFKVRPTRGG